MTEEWYTQLARARATLNIGQAELAERAGVSVESIKAYENGRRRPTRARLLRVLDAVQMPRAEANALLAAAGFAPITETAVPVGPTAWHAMNQLEQVADRVPWPVFVLNELIEVVVANSAFQALTGVDFSQEFSDSADRNLLMLASTPRFADRIENWDEAVGILIAVWKGNWYQPASVDDPSPYFARVLERFAQGDPRYVARFVKLWSEVDLLPVKQRWEYPIVWVDPQFGRLRFTSLVYAGDDPTGLFSFNDWIPTDADTWLALDRLTAARRNAGAERPGLP